MCGSRSTAYTYTTLLSTTQRQAAIDLVSAAIKSGIFNDLGSGSNVDVCVIEKEKTDMYRNLHMPNERAVKEQKYLFPKGTTPYTKEFVRSMIVQEGRWCGNTVV